jgi:hypothetical protein
VDLYPDNVLAQMLLVVLKQVLSPLPTDQEFMGFKLLLP